MRRACMALLTACVSVGFAGCSGIQSGETDTTSRTPSSNPTTVEVPAPYGTFAVKFSEFEEMCALRYTVEVDLSRSLSEVDRTALLESFEQREGVKSVNFLTSEQIRANLLKKLDGEMPGSVRFELSQISGRAFVNTENVDHALAVRKSIEDDEGVTAARVDDFGIDSLCRRYGL